MPIPVISAIFRGKELIDVGHLSVQYSNNNNNDNDKDNDNDSDNDNDNDDNGNDNDNDNDNDVDIDDTTTKIMKAARRIGKKTDKPRPIAVTFATLGSKIKVMQQKKALNDTDYYLKDDYPYHVLEKRKMLQEQVKIEQEKGNKAIIKYDKLVVLKHNKTDADHTDNRKRYLSISPQHEKIAKKNTSSTSTQAAKKNKTVQSHTTLQRSSSISEGVIKPGMLNFLVNKKDLQSDEEKNKRNNNNK
ncbi:hypothetical protein EVAR_78043_1 [Eumeta japonica]|uniref:Uncharacterized protein n=1 Tax=Eumeta variegata TaxID=151549 RepID=A0A4C1T2S9_EUMVA|nr:hypothetical protein EVAR_78043_1 [Eumeta japonica]